ncbi:MAG: ribose-phosphate pyrophosphokinase [bacterium]|nr:ribose-phosphate pyrophosphokinase [bacterium]
MRIFSGTASQKLAEEVAAYLKKPLGKVDVGRFPNGEVRVEILESVRGCDVFLIQSTCPPVDQNLMELLIMMDALRRASAASINIIIPYFGYSKQDKKKTGREPISAKLVADMVSIAGATRVLSIDLHATQIEGFFRVPVDNLTAVTIIGEYFKKKKLNDVVVVAPDAGGTKRARDLANLLHARLAIIDKYRHDFRKANAMNVVGKVEGHDAIIIDDFIDTGSSIVEAVKALNNHGAKKVWVCCTHAVLTDPAKEKLSGLDMEELVTTNTIEVPEEKRFEKLKIITVANLLGECIKRIAERKSLAELFLKK